MPTHVVSFNAKLAKQIDQHVSLAGEVWREAQGDLGRLSITAGNYAGYGAYASRCHANGVLEFPIGNVSSVLVIDGKRQLVIADGIKPQRFFGILLHEVGHHVVNTARSQPWSDIRGIGSSTHLNGSWIWICCTAWNHVHGLSIDPARVAGSVGDNRDAWVGALRSFNPFSKPPALDQMPRCQQCDSEFAPKRSDAKYCSTRCRVSANRATHGTTSA